MTHVHSRVLKKVPARKKGEIHLLSGWGGAVLKSFQIAATLLSFCWVNWAEVEPV
jgi:hypothetical protein